jgi:hypothetical protein
MCSQCGNDVAEGSAACPRCGAQLSPGQGGGVRAAAVGGPATAAVTAPFGFDLKRLTRADQIVGGATAVFLISLFLPWFSSSAGIYSGSVNGLWHGYMYIDLILALAILVYLVLRAGFEELPFRLPFRPEQGLLAATGIVLLLAVISFVFKPTGGGVVSIGWGFGAFLGLAAAVTAAAPLGLPALRSRTGR